MMKKVTVMTLAVILALFALTVSASAGEQGELGRLTKLNVDEDTLTDAIAESYFALVPFSGYRFFDTLNSMISALTRGRIEGMALDAYTAQYMLSRAEEYAIYTPAETVPSYNLNFCMLFREENTALCDSVSGAIKAIRDDGALDALKKQYIDDIIAGEDPEAVTPERFDGAQTLKVAVTGDRPPMDYFSGTSQPIGFNTAIVSEIGKRLGMNVEFVSIDTGARSVALASGLADVVFWMEAGDYGNWEMADVEDQPASTVVTTPYLTGAYTLVVLASSPLAESNGN